MAPDPRRTRQAGAMDASTLRTRATAIDRDLRALGVGAPVRAGLERYSD